MTRRPLFILVCVAILAAAGICASAALLRPAASATHFADADDKTLAMEGKPLYRAHCASCHGRALQGQPLWQLRDEFFGRRAPAHDETGHTWQHGDEDLFRITKFGWTGPEQPAPPSAMPGFKDVMSDHEILAVLAFIKARWPLGLRVSQAMLNPGFAGLPANADQVEWRLPSNCLMSWRRTQQDAPKP